MEFCIISPTAGLEKYATLSKTHLVLSHLCEGSWEFGSLDYKMFYRERKEAGDFIILDNGAYEGKTSINAFVIESLEPDVVVLPDFYLKPWQMTWHAAIACLDTLPDVLSHKPEWLYIPQAQEGDLVGFIESYHRAIEDPRITWLGIPRALAYAITRDPLMRVKFAEQAKRDRPDIKLHAFGMVNGDVHELPYLAHAGVDSIDSSAPVWRGWNAFDIHDKTWDGKPVDFNAPDAPLQEALIKSNLEACGVRTTETR